MRLLAIFIATSILAGCGGTDEATDRPTVVAGFYPLAWAAERIGGPDVRVVNLTPAGAEPHDLELSPRDATAVRDAELVVYVGGFQRTRGRSRNSRRVSLDVLGADDDLVWLDEPLCRVARMSEPPSTTLWRAGSRTSWMRSTRNIARASTSAHVVRSSPPMQHSARSPSATV
jgi:hypothetical protein